MKRKVIKVGLNPRSIDNAIKEIKAYKKWLADKISEFVDELAKQGLDIAQLKYQEADLSYTGTKDVSVNIEKREDVTAIVAVGNSVLFIEFGTGVITADDHPDKPAGIAARGTFGQGKGSQKTWGFYGDETGTAGWFATKKVGTDVVEIIPHVVLTHGTKANQTLYLTGQELKDRIESTAKRVFK